MPDAHANFAFSTVATAPVTALAGTSLAVQANDGALFPAPPFNAVVCPAGTPPRAANAEIVRVTARTGSPNDTFTIVRGPQAADPGGINRSIIVGDQIFAAMTAKTLTDVEGALTVARAYRNAAQNLGAAGWTKILLDTDLFDPGNNTDLVNHRYVAPATGYYLVQGQVAAVIANNPQGLSAFISKNSAATLTTAAGVEGDYKTIRSGTNGDLEYLTVEGILQLNATDYAELWGYNSGASVVTLAVGANYLNYLSVVRVA